MTPAAGPGKPQHAGNTAAMESLYPFLYAGGGDLNAVMEEVRRSTVAKTAEIADLRRRVCARDAGRLRACAEDMAGRFSAGGRLLEDGLAVVDTGSGEEEVSVAFVPAAPGDTILVHAGEAIAVVPS